MSNAEKRSVFTDALATLGTIIGEGEARDAIHLAVEPVTAGETLYPAQHVHLADGVAKLSGGNCVGIVDPFLVNPVHAGQRFWLVVYPRQITSLRHVWEHPAFPPSGETAAAQLAEPATDEDPQTRSERWIRDWCMSIPLDYNIVMGGARDYVVARRRGDYGEYLCFGGLLEGEYVPDEFWTHYETVTGDKVEQDHRGSFFTCSC